jgi:hypothetical protein
MLVIIELDSVIYTVIIIYLFILELEVSAVVPPDSVFYIYIYI